MFPYIMVCKHVPLRNSGDRLIRWPWGPVSSIPAMQRAGLRFSFHVRSAVLQGIQRGHFQTVSLPVGGHLTVSHKMEKLRLSHLSWNVPPSPLFLPFLVPLAFFSSLLAFRLRLTVVFSTILRGSSGSFLLCFPFFHQRQILSLLLQREGSSVSWLHPFPSPNFPFQSPSMFFIVATLEIRVFVRLLGLLNISMDLLLVFSSGNLSAGWQNTSRIAREQKSPSKY